MLEKRCGVCPWGGEKESATVPDVNGLGERVDYTQTYECVPLSGFCPDEPLRPRVYKPEKDAEHRTVCLGWLELYRWWREDGSGIGQRRSVMRLQVNAGGEHIQSCIDRGESRRSNAAMFPWGTLGDWGRSGHPGGSRAKLIT